MPVDGAVAAERTQLGSSSSRNLRPPESSRAEESLAVADQAVGQAPASAREAGAANRGSGLAEDPARPAREVCLFRRRVVVEIEDTRLVGELSASPLGARPWVPLPPELVAPAPGRFAGSPTWPGVGGRDEAAPSFRRRAPGERDAAGSRPRRLSGAGPPPGLGAGRERRALAGQCRRDLALSESRESLLLARGAEGALAGSRRDGRGLPALPRLARPVLGFLARQSRSMPTSVEGSNGPIWPIGCRAPMQAAAGCFRRPFSRERVSGRLRRPREGVSPLPARIRIR